MKRTRETKKPAAGVRRGTTSVEGVPGAARAPWPRTVEPQLATLVAAAPESEDWLHEIKWDGYRLLASVRDGKTVLKTRGGLDWTARYRAVADVLARGPWSEAIFDGEVVALDDSGASDFQALQNLANKMNARPTYMIFDLLYLDGWDLREAPLQVRKDRLAEVLQRAAFDPRDVRLSEHVVGRGQDYLGHACRLGLEGIVSKRRDGTYKAGRSGTWLKSKCGARQELVIGGYSEPAGSRQHVGALLLGVQSEGKLRYAGRTGTGFTEASLKALKEKLVPLEQATSPFTPAPRGAEARGAHWVKPVLVAEVSFAGFTADGRVRQASFRGLREDKPAAAVVQERPVPDAAAPSAAKKPRARAATTAIAAKKPRAQVAAAPRVTSEKNGAHAVDALTHPDRVLFPDVGVTKQDLLTYYESVASRLVPLVAERPLTLFRCPGGRQAACFFQKHAEPESKGGTPPGLRRAPVLERDARKPVDYWVLEDERGLAALVQRAALELHLWGAKAASLEVPERLVIDLDPGEGVAWTALAGAAKEARARLRAFGLESFLLSTGGKGLHVVAPVAPPDKGPWGWDEARQVAEAVAREMAADSPSCFVAQAAKNARPGRIFVDYLRNGRGATAVAPYSTRARAGAPIACPLAWDVLALPAQPALATVRDWLASPPPDPWGDYAKVAEQSVAGQGARRAAKGARPPRTRDHRTEGRP